MVNGRSPTRHLPQAFLGFKSNEFVQDEIHAAFSSVFLAAYGDCRAVQLPAGEGRLDGLILASALSNALPSLLRVRIRQIFPQRFSI